MKPVIIHQSIFEVRGQKIMLDFDLAELYGIETKRLKEAVRRNRKKFPADFMFELSKKEWINLRTQIATSSWGGSRYLPFAFTEHGVTNFPMGKTPGGKRVLFAIQHLRILLLILMSLSFVQLVKRKRGTHYFY